MEELLELIKAKLEEKKAEDISIIDISELSIMADYFVIASGSNANQIHAMADFLEEEYERYRINQNQDYETWRIHEELLKKNEEYHPLCFIRLKGVLDDYENRGLLKWDISEQDKFHLICELIDALKNKEEI